LYILRILENKPDTNTKKKAHSQLAKLLDPNDHEDDDVQTDAPADITVASVVVPNSTEDLQGEVASHECA
jgi:hypothetical protein